MTLIEEIEAAALVSDDEFARMLKMLWPDIRAALEAAEEMREIIQHHWPQDTLREDKMYRASKRFNAAFKG